MASGVREIVRGFNSGSSEGNPGTVVLNTGEETQAADILEVWNFAYGGGVAAMLSPSPGTWTLVGIGRNDATDNPHIKVWRRVAGSSGSLQITTNHSATGFSASQQHAHLFVLSDTELAVPSGGFAQATGFASAQNAPSATGVADGIRISGWISDDEVNYSSALSEGGETDSGSSTAYTGWETTAGGATGTETANSGSDKTFTAATSTTTPAATGEHHSGGSTVTVNVVASGSGSPQISGGSDATVVVSSEGVGSPQLSNGSTSTVDIVSSGAGSPQVSNGSTAVVSCTAEGAGSPQVSGGSTALVVVIAQGETEQTQVDVTVLVGPSRAGSVAVAGSRGGSVLAGQSRAGSALVGLSRAGSVTVGPSREDRNP